MSPPVNKSFLKTLVLLIVILNCLKSAMVFSNIKNNFFLFRIFAKKIVECGG